MGNVTRSEQNNITSPNGNSLAVFVEGGTGEMKVKDVLGNIQPISDFTGGSSPFQLNANGSGIQPVLGNNTASGCSSTVGGGKSNTSSSIYSTVGGGFANTASGYCSFVGGGYYNTVSGSCSTIVGGKNNVASGNVSFIGGGFENVANGITSAILGGQCNTTNNYTKTMIVGSDICANRGCTTFVNNLSIIDIPTSGVGLPVGSVYRNGNSLCITT
jgi:hypothetical protein